MLHVVASMGKSWSDRLLRVELKEGLSAEVMEHRKEADLVHVGCSSWHIRWQVSVCMHAVKV